MTNFLLKCAVLLALAATLTAAQQPLNFRKHKTISNLPLACQNHLNAESGGDSTEGPCTLLEPVYDASDYTHNFCVVCSCSGSGNDLSQSIQTLANRKIASDRTKFTRKSDLYFLIKGVDQPVDLSMALSSSPAVLRRVEDAYFVFNNGQMGRAEYEHGRPGRLESVSCRMCAGGIGQQSPLPPTGFGAGSSQATTNEAGYNSGNSGYRNFGYQNVNDDDDQDD